MTNTDETARRLIRVTLRYIEILDSLDLDTVGEFRFRFRAGVPERGEVVETRIPDPEKSPLAISEHPAMNRVSFNQVLFEGEVGPTDSLLLEAEGEDHDRLSRNDALNVYRREFDPPVEDAIGEHTPWDEGSTEEADPEQLGNWRFAYAVEAVEPAPGRATTARTGSMDGNRG